MSLEIPLAILEDIYPLTDMGFTLAHMALKNAWYVKFYHGKPQIMDNSMYELGEPLSSEDLREAAAALAPQAIIAPDWMDDSTQTSKVSILTRNSFRSVLFETHSPDGEHRLIEPSVGIVVQGKNLKERMEFFEYAQDQKFSPICFPFRNRDARRVLITALASDNQFKAGEWYHLLGLNNRLELELIKEFLGHWSFDTAKPCKPTLNMMDRGMAWSGHPRLDYSRGYTSAELDRVYHNIDYLRRILA